MRVTHVYFTCLLIAVIKIAQPAAAATATATMAISATVTSLCTIAATPLPFGNYVSTVGQTGTANLTVVCTLATPYNVSLDAGQGAGATVSTRKMTFGSSTLNYKLTSDAAHTTNIGQTVGTDTLSGAGLGLAQTLTIYGQIPSGQNVPAGAYSDNVVATITY